MPIPDIRTRKLLLGVFTWRAFSQSTNRRKYLYHVWLSYKLLLRKPVEPRYKKFNALSPQYSDVGEAMLKAWKADRKRFEPDDMESLINWTIHELTVARAHG